MSAAYSCTYLHSSFAPNSDRSEKGEEFLFDKERGRVGWSDTHIDGDDEEDTSN